MRFADASPFRTGLRDDLGAALCVSGRLDEARALLPLAPSGALQMMIAVYDGDWENVRKAWRQEPEALERSGNRAALGNRCHLLAELARIVGDRAEAERLRSLELSIALDGGSRALELRARSGLALTLAEAGRPQEAAPHIDAARAILAAGEPWGRRAARFALAEAAVSSALEGRPADACFDVAVRGCWELALPWDEAEARLLWAAASRETNADAARTQLAEAIALYDRLGAASRWIERARLIAG
jgi:tetratricopeptide (TPR) repeat protein